MRKIFIDGGCHKGQSILKARKKYGNDIEIIGFEATPYLAYRLQQYYRNDNKVTVNWNALWKEDGVQSFYLPKKGASWSNSVYRRWEDSLVQQVPSLDLSTWLKNNVTEDDYVILKLDIEGAEYEVLNKMISDGTVNLIDEFHGEWHEDKISNLDKEVVANVQDFFNREPFHIWEAEWLDESTPGMTKIEEHLDVDQNWAKVNPFQKITFVIPSRNNLEFLQLAYDSIRKLETKHEVLVLNDASTDGTAEWIDAQDDEDLIVYHNPGPERIGIVGMFDKGIEMARTEIIMAFHADMVACKDLDKNILKHLTPGSVVSATRVEPPLHPDGPEKILRNFGVEVEEFKMDVWLDQAEELKENRVTEGIFAPWCMYREDFLAIGGHDELFAPQSKEDSDLFNRFVLNGYKVLQSWDALVYHFTSRGSRFNKHAGGAAGKNSEEWLYTTNKNMRNFIRKWGTIVLHNSLMKPIIPPKYDIAFRVSNPNIKLLHALEPWCSRIHIGVNNDELVNEYIQQEQPNTILNLRDRINVYDGDSEIAIYINGNTFNQQDYQVIQQLSQIIQDSGAIGKFALGNLEVSIQQMNEYQNNLINN